MAKFTPVVGAFVVVSVLWPHAGRAASDDVATLRAEIEALKADYSSRIQALEGRIRQLESAVATAQATQSGAAPDKSPPGGSAAGGAPPVAASAASALPPAFPQPSGVATPAKSSSATAFNPA